MSNRYRQLCVEHRFEDEDDWSPYADNVIIAVLTLFYLEQASRLIASPPSRSPGWEDDRSPGEPRKNRDLAERNDELVRVLPKSYREFLARFNGWPHLGLFPLEGLRGPGADRESGRLVIGMSAEGAEISIDYSGSEGSQEQEVVLGGHRFPSFLHFLTAQSERWLSHLEREVSVGSIVAESTDERVQSLSSLVWANKLYSDIRARGKLEDHGAELRRGCGETDLSTIERALGRRLPPSYRRFLLFSNGWEYFELLSTKELIDHRPDGSVRSPEGPQSVLVIKGRRAYPGLHIDFSRPLEGQEYELVQVRGSLAVGVTEFRRFTSFDEYLEYELSENLRQIRKNLDWWVGQ